MPPKLHKGPRIRTATYGRGGGEVDEEDVSIANARRFAEIARRAELDTQMGFSMMNSGSRLGWMMNMQSVCS